MANHSPNLSHLYYVTKIFCNLFFMYYKLYLFYSNYKCSYRYSYNCYNWKKFFGTLNLFALNYFSPQQKNIIIIKNIVQIRELCFSL